MHQRLKILSELLARQPHDPRFATRLSGASTRQLDQDIKDFERSAGAFKSPTPFYVGARVHLNYEQRGQHGRPVRLVSRYDEALAWCWEPIDWTPHNHSQWDFEHSFLESEQ